MEFCAVRGLGSCCWKTGVRERNVTPNLLYLLSPVFSEFFTLQ